jgi:hypothetical protein
VTISWPQATGVSQYDIIVGIATNEGTSGGVSATQVISGTYFQVDANTTTYTITGLIGGLPSDETWAIEVDAVGASGSMSPPVPGPSADVTIPGTFVTPTSPVWPNGSTVTSSDVTATGASLTWTPAWNVLYVFGGDAPVSYAVYNGNNLLGTTTNINYNVSNLSPGTPYIFQVEASYGSVWISGPSISVTTPYSSSQGETIPPSAGELNIHGGELGRPTQNTYRTAVDEGYAQEVLSAKITSRPANATKVY